MNKTLLFSKKKEIIKKLDKIKKKIRLHHSKAKQKLDVVWQTNDSDEISREHAYIFNLAIQIGFIEELKKMLKNGKTRSQTNELRRN